MSKPIAIFVADTHLGDKAPVSRKDNWYKAMESTMMELQGWGKEYNVPIIHCGDIFDKPANTPKLEVKAMKWLKGILCIMGNHDLTGHRLDKVEESSLGVMKVAEAVTILESGFAIDMGDWELTAFHYGEELKPNTSDSKKLKVAVIHADFYQKLPFVGCDKGGSYKKVAKKLNGFDVIISGHIHIPFDTVFKDTTCVCVGGAFQRTASELEHKPRAVLLNDDSTVESLYFNTDEVEISRDHVEQANERNDRLNAFIDTLSEDIDMGLCFENNLKKYIDKNNIDKQITDKIYNKLEAL